MIEYVVGFLCDESRVVLIEKKRPSWQAGKLNGVGGKIEPGETPHEAMQREFLEEAGLNINNWELGVVMSGSTWKMSGKTVGPRWKVYFFSAYGPTSGAQTQTDEIIWIASRSTILSEKVIPNLRWLIPLCLDPTVSRPVNIQSA